MEKILVSFCIPVYNQIDMVKECIGEILKYPGNDIEIVVNDDCSADDIKGLVEGFRDGRVNYYRNDANLGHDLNILSSFRNAKSDFAFLLRVRDRVLHTGIPFIIERIKKNPSMAYLTGKAVDETGKTRLTYQKERYAKGKQALSRHMSLYLHPSGSMYSLKLLDLAAQERFFQANNDTKLGFLVHHTMRLELALKGDFEFIHDAPIWQYTDTLRSSDIAVNSDKSRISVFAPVYVRKRFLREMEWADLCLPKKYKQFIFQWMIKRYLNLVTWGFKFRNETPAIRQHYNCEKMEFSIRAERRLFRGLAKQKIRELSIGDREKNKLFFFLDLYTLSSMTYLPARFYLRKLLIPTFIYRRHTKRKVKRGVS